MKKLIAIVLTVAMLAATLISCGKTNDTNTEAGANTGDAGTLTVWTEKIFSEEANKMYEDRIQEFAKLKGITIKSEFIAAVDFMKNLNATIEAGNVPDITTSAPTKVLSYYPNNPYADMTELVNKINTERPYFDAVYEGNKIDNKFYFAPMTSSSALMFIRKDKMQEQGITEEPKTWNDVIELARKLSAPDQEFYGLGIGCGPTDEDCENTMRTMLWNSGASILDKEGKFSLNQQAGKDLINKYVELYNEKTIPPAASTWDPSGNNKSYLMGESAIVFNAPTLYNALKKDAPEIFENTLVLAPPSAEDGSKTLMGFPYGPAIMEASKNKELAGELIEFLFEKEWYDKYLEATAPVYSPLFKDAEENAFWQEGINKQVVEYAKNASGFYGYPVEPIEGRALAAKDYFTFPMAKLLNSIVTGGTSVDDALAQTQKDLESIKASLK